MKKYFRLNNNTIAYCDKKMINQSVKALWNSFCMTDGNIDIKEGENFTFRIGESNVPSLPDGCEYALSVTEKGVGISGNDFGGLMRGYFSLLMKIEALDSGFGIAEAEEIGKYKIKNRMIHICVFPENDLYFIKKLIRLAGLCQYTHIVIEFWGMLEFDCMKELSWQHAFTKQEARELITIAREMGMEPIPMSNQLGHATAARLKYGKHVVLDQNPRLYRLFTPDGWAWNIFDSEVKDLLRNIRAELYEVFGHGEYFHIGCDEAYYYSRHEEINKRLPEYLKYLTEAVESEGRRPMLWMDMMLSGAKYDAAFYTSSKYGGEIEMINALSKNTVMVDWQYNIKTAPIPSTVDLAIHGYDLIGAPWYNPDNYKAHVKTVADNKLFGVMLTTWHTLKDYMPSILGCAKEMGAVSHVWSEYSGLHEECATLLRRVSFEGNTYTDSGWSKEQIEI
ncbi:MAG: hypothetical protein E7613_07140 [Ruminococcaceae bacterium]|nr:hypothetical protein [Oscillospiraceae bacterium]